MCKYWHQTYRGQFMETDREKIRKRLEKDGWQLARHGRAHDVYKHPKIGGVITLPRHKELTSGVVRSIAKKASWDDF